MNKIPRCLQHWPSISLFRLDSAWENQNSTGRFYPRKSRPDTMPLRNPAKRARSAAFSWSLTAMMQAVWRTDHRLTIWSAPGQATSKVEKECMLKRNICILYIYTVYAVVSSQEMSKVHSDPFGTTIFPPVVWVAICNKYSPQSIAAAVPLAQES